MPQNTDLEPTRIKPDGATLLALTAIFRDGVDLATAARAHDRLPETIEKACTSPIYKRHIETTTRDFAAHQRQRTVHRLIQLRDQTESKSAALKAAELLLRELREQDSRVSNASAQPEAPGYRITLRQPDGTSVEINSNVVRSAVGDRQSPPETGEVIEMPVNPQK